MRVLLVSMPDSFEHMPSVGIRMPNGALTSLAGNVDAHHDVAVADLVLVQDRVRETLLRLLDERDPEIVGLSVMTFQRPTARKVVGLVREVRPRARIVVGGYDPSLAPRPTSTSPTSSCAARASGPSASCCPHWRAAAGVRGSRGSPTAPRTGGTTNAPRPIARLEDGSIRPPRRQARVLSGYTLLGRPVDVVETSRGCTFDCSFCSIIAMRGATSRLVDGPRAGRRARRARPGGEGHLPGGRQPHLDVRRFEAMCRALIEAGLNDVEYLVQAMTSAIAQAGDTLAPLMRRRASGTCSWDRERARGGPGFLRAEAKNRRREDGRAAGNATLAAIEHLHRNGMWWWAG